MRWIFKQALWVVPGVACVVGGLLLLDWLGAPMDTVRLGLLIAALAYGFWTYYQYYVALRDEDEDD